MKIMHQFVQDEGTSMLKGAQLTAVILGLPGQSFKSVTDNLRKVYPKWLRAVASGTPLPVPPDGWTGRKLRVQTRHVVKDGAKTSRISQFPDDVEVDLEGYAIVPDNRQWRNLVKRGFAILYGVID